MRILNVTAQKPDSTGSGVYLSELMKGFHQMGHAQALLAGVYQEDEIMLPKEVLTFPVYFSTEELPFPILGMSDEMPYVSTRYSDMTPDMTVQFRKAYETRIKAAIAQFQPEVILCHHLYYVTSLVKELAENIPVYAVSHGSDLRQIKKNPWQREYIKSQIAKLDGIFALHKEQKQDIINYFGCEEAQVKVIGTGYNSHRFFIDEEIKEEKNTEEIRYIFAGKISEKKGVMSFMRSLSYLAQFKEEETSLQEKKLRFTLAGGYGNEEEYAYIQKLAQEAPYPVEFAGKLSQEELARALNGSDVFVLPSFYEGLPLVLVEAIACGLEVICTDLPGIRPWLDDKIPEHGVEFITPPKMQREDEPEEDSLLEFEQRLAEGICKMGKKVADLQGRIIRKQGLEGISWEGLCNRIIALVER